MEWISVKDRLPEAGFDVLLVRIRDSDLPAMAVFVGETIEGYWKVQPLFGNWYAANDKVTHWMPLPEAPKEGKDLPRSITLNIYAKDDKNIRELTSLVVKMIGSAYREKRKNG